MDRKIKTRQVHKDIKVLDKTVTVTDHIKQSYVRTKENVMQSTEKSSDRYCTTEQRFATILIFLVIRRWEDETMYGCR